MLIHNTIPNILHDILLAFRDTGKKLQLKGDLLKMITNKNYNVDLASLSDKKSEYDFAEERNFDTKAQGNKSTRERTVMKLLKSTGLMVSATGVSKTKFLFSDPDELCESLTLLLQEKEVVIILIKLARKLLLELIVY